MISVNLCRQSRVRKAQARKRGVFSISSPFSAKIHPFFRFSPARSVLLVIKILHKIPHFKHLKLSKQETAGVQKPSEIHLLKVFVSHFTDLGSYTSE